MDDEQREKLDYELNKIIEIDFTKSELGAVVKKRQPPAWWKGQSAAASSIQAARDLGYTVGKVG